MSALSSNKKKLVASFIQFLRQEVAANTHSEDEKESLEVAIQCLETGFSLTETDMSFQPSRPLVDSFATSEGLSKPSSGSAQPPKPVREPTEAEKQQAEELKNAGNDLMRSGSYDDAVQKYTEAVNLHQNAVYYCNRAAAYTKLGQHDLSIQDCREAINIDSEYSKAYGRMGLALSCQNRYGEAVDAYQRALELEPDNENYKNNLEIAQQRVQEQAASAGAQANPFGGLGAMGAGAGGFDIGNLLNNPAMMNMATQMMSDPNMQNMMSNMMGAMMGGGAAGGAGQPGEAGAAPAPGLNNLMQAGQQLAAQMQNMNPDMVDQLRQQFNNGDQPPPPEGGNPPSGGQGGAGSG